MAEKKSFKVDVNSFFLSGAEELAKDPERQEATTPAEIPAEIRETKSDRLQLLIRPSVNKALAKVAHNFCRRFIELSGTPAANGFSRPSSLSSLAGAP